MQTTEEDRAGYTRSSFKYGNPGEDKSDGCHTRADVLLAEAVVAPTAEAGCRLTGGKWISCHGGRKVTIPGALEIDHADNSWSAMADWCRPPGRSLLRGMSRWLWQV
ncbi:hypothetical protein ABZS83_32090 [Streptomyces sp. NPDC005426]|uniref:hypothetical protein n=1 Tax=Streptomyces sp. NPDC005426 TaxID=3155344 RepID=UPI0033A01291